MPITRNVSDVYLEDTYAIQDFLPDLSALIHEDFGPAFALTLLSWCDLLNDDPAKDSKQNYWKLWAVQTDLNGTIGVCGLYAIEDRRDELWLGWLGIIPELRNQGVGKQVLDLVTEHAKRLGCKTLFAYVDEKRKPMNFYLKNGFTEIGRVGPFLESRDMPFDKDYFESNWDFVISKDL